MEKIVSDECTNIEETAEMKEIKKKSRKFRKMVTFILCAHNSKHKNNPESKNVLERDPTKIIPCMKIAENIDQDKNISSLNCVEDVENLKMDIESYRSVLEIKQEEIKALKLALTKAKQTEAALETAEKEARLLNSRCDVLKDNLLRKTESEKNLLKELLDMKKMLKKNIKKPTVK